MKTLAAIIVLTYVGGVPVLAQTAPAPAAGKVYSFKDLTPQEVGIIGKGLTKLPYEESAGLLNKLQQQISAQDQPVPEPAAPAGPPVKGKK